jgi:hypothetical protein
VTLLEQATVVINQALEAEVGVLVQCQEPEKAKAALYAARKANPDPKALLLQIRTWPTDEGELAVVKGLKGLKAQAKRLVRLEDLSGLEF